MSERGRTRERILDAFEAILTTEGERAATLDAVAARAEVSKGGLLYHFASKDALVDGLVERLHALVEQDVGDIRSASSGPIEYLLRTSVSSGTPLERSAMACFALAGAQDERVRAALREMQDAWLAVVRESVPDPVLARVVSLVSDGLYFNSVLREGGGSIGREDLDAIVAYVTGLLDDPQ
ncbi:TetR/AcrR family transcriptional regulator [Planctomonas sp. JC2975]|uniref:TetR/AcrR family transcriptional regulator n=1 Tax=Planctomonas sp. JC2975 TaxID=2729626 RepID=UPI001472B066|nr:TetR/AcrR family transcriptional regulator [Planctomonas sp. JC2975]NNC11052.1 TetR/AcrR family transcriptional regulator [Planctomonas sp. JC2975]